MDPNRDRTLCAAFGKTFVRKDTVRKNALREAEKADAEIERLEFQVQSLRRRIGDPPPTPAPTPPMPGDSRRGNRRITLEAVGEAVGVAQYLRRRASLGNEIRRYEAKIEERRRTASSAYSTAERLRLEV